MHLATAAQDLCRQVGDYSALRFGIASAGPGGIESANALPKHLNRNAQGFDPRRTSTDVPSFRQ